MLEFGVWSMKVPPASYCKYPWFLSSSAVTGRPCWRTWSLQKRSLGGLWAKSRSSCLSYFIVVGFFCFAMIILALWTLMYIYIDLWWFHCDEFFWRRPGEQRQKPSAVPMASFAYSYGVKNMEAVKTTLWRSKNWSLYHSCFTRLPMVRENSQEMQILHFLHPTNCNSHLPPTKLPLPSSNHGLGNGSTWLYVRQLILHHLGTVITRFFCYSFCRRHVCTFTLDWFQVGKRLKVALNGWNFELSTTFPFGMRPRTSTRNINMYHVFFFEYLV